MLSNTFLTHGLPALASWSLELLFRINPVRRFSDKNTHPSFPGWATCSNRHFNFLNIFCMPT